MTDEVKAGQDLLNLLIQINTENVKLLTELQQNIENVEKALKLVEKRIEFLADKAGWVFTDEAE